MFPQDYKGKDMSGEGEASRGCRKQVPILAHSYSIWHTPRDSILSRLIHPREQSQHLSKQKAQAEAQLEIPQRSPLSLSHFMHERRIPQGGPGLPALGGPFTMSVSFCLLQGNPHSQGVQTEIPCWVT